MQIRMPKVRRTSDGRPVYGNDHDPTYREVAGQAGGDRQFRRTFTRVVILCIVLLVMIILAIVTATLPATSGSQARISAADTYAVSPVAQAEMKQTVENFISGMILFSYSTDEAAAQEGKAMALSCMAQGTTSWSLVENMEYEGGELAPDALGVVIGGISMDAGTHAYAGRYTYVGRGGAADTTAVDEENPDGRLVDKGYRFELTFSQVADQDGRAHTWKITEAKIQTA